MNMETIMQAKDIMTPAVITVRPDATVNDIAGLLMEKNISAVPVLDDNDALVGIVSEGDLMRRIAGTDMMCQRAAAMGFGAHGDIHTQPAKNPDSTGIDPGIKRPLRTAGQQNNPPCRTNAR